MKSKKESKKKGILQAFKSSPNAMANTKATSRSKTGVKGVYLTGPQRGKPCYQARITIPGEHREKVVYNGHDFKKACKARKQAERIYYEPIIKEARKQGFTITNK